MSFTTNKQTISTEYAAIDLAKIFFCVCILFRHTGAYHEIPYSWYFQHGIFCLAVPFFFIVSGYFLGCKVFRPNANLRQEFISYESRLLLPYLIFSVINTGLAAISIIINSEKLIWEFAKLIRNVIFYPYGALWYIWASMIGAAILYYFLKHNKIRTAVFLGCLGYLFALICNSYYFVIVNTPVQFLVDIYLKITTSARNGFFVGFPLLGIGMLLAHYREKLSSPPVIRLAAIGFPLFCILSLGEIHWIRSQTVADDHSLFLSQLILLPSLFILLLNCRNFGKKTDFYLLRQMSSGIYFVHRPLLTCTRWILPAIGLTQVNGITQFFLLLILSCGICYPFYRLGWNRHAYSLILSKTGKFISPH